MAQEKIIFRPILPKNPKYFETLEQELFTELAVTMQGPVARTLKNAEEARIANWDHKPNIVAEFERQVTQLKLTVKPKGTNKRYWVFVSFGTPEHQISPQKYPYLTIKTGYSPKTRPNNMYGGPGSYTGSIYYPGTVTQSIKPRKFEEHIVKQYGASIIAALTLTVQKVLARQ